MNNAPKPAPPKKSPVVPALIFAVLVIIAAIGYKRLKSASPEPPSAPPPAADATPSVPAPSPAAQSPEQPQETGAAAESPAPVPSVPPPPSAPPAAVADPKDLVSILATLTGKEPVTPEQARNWKDSLQQLIRQGAGSVPAIQQFLAQNLDANFAGVSGADALGYNSLRSAMLDALAQIGGAESTQAMLQILQSSIYPTDIATLAKTLDAQSPGQYQQAILDAVRQQLNMSGMDQLGGANVLPLFQVLAGEAANGANVSADLAQYAEKWPYYSAGGTGPAKHGCAQHLAEPGQKRATFRRRPVPTGALPGGAGIPTRPAAKPRSRRILDVPHGWWKRGFLGLRCRRNIDAVANQPAHFHY
jgi:hypothetical protein